MKRNTLQSWIFAPLFLLATATCSGNDISGQDQCASGIDSDSDGLTNDQECLRGSDPNNPDSDGDGASDGAEVAAGSDPLKTDSDGDGLSDGAELAYPKICVAADPFNQRRPPPACTTGDQCASGEVCQGLNPTNPDTDGDGVADAEEDKNLDGTITVLSGETDPRLWDTDGAHRQGLHRHQRLHRAQVPDPRAERCDPVDLPAGQGSGQRLDGAR